MKRVKQISVDIMVDGNIDGCELATQIARDLVNKGNIILGASFQGDLTEEYKRAYPELLEESEETEVIEMENNNIQFTNEELQLLSDGMLALIDNSCNALQLVRDKEVINALFESQDRYNELNDKICAMLEGDRSDGI